MDKVRSPLNCYRSQFNENFSMTIKSHEKNCLLDSENLCDSWSSNVVNDGVSNPSDLVSLAWLQKGDILQIAPLDGEEDSSSDLINSTVSFNSVKSEDSLNSRVPKSDTCDQGMNCISPLPSGTSVCYTTTRTSQRPSSVNDEQMSAFDFDSSRYSQNSTISIGNPNLTKPNYSYTHLIFMAIESTPQKCMTVNQIYNWCESNFPFYKHAGAGWKNSLRHNLSINKSFKRLPRDSRNEPYVLVKCRSLSLLCPPGNEHDDSEDDEGPGRGAFWTVEPRERPTLLDAIKRNPWNFANMTALTSNQSDSTNHSSISRSLNLRRFGLARSAPGQLLRAEGFGHIDSQSLQFDKLGSIVNGVGGPIRILYTADGRVIASCDNSFTGRNLDQSEFMRDINDNPISRSVGYILPDHRYWSSPSGDTTSTEGATAEIEWPAEEEEKYLSTLRLLTETDEVDAVDSNLPKNDSNDQAHYRPSESKLENCEVAHDDGKLVTKQRRKSRLQPTRITDETYSYPSITTATIVGKCNECKENVTGCESCQAKRYRFLNDPRLRKSLEEYALMDVINTLDSDQEHGPAGGPVIRHSNPKSQMKSTTVPDEPSKNKEEEKNFNFSENETSNEVFVTPAPYIDHEYSHCQAQLRRPEETEVVDIYNENYRLQKLKSIIQCHPLLKNYADSKFLGISAENIYRSDEDLEFTEDGDDGFSSQENDFSEEEFSNERQMGRDLNYNETHEYRRTRRRGGYRRRIGVPNRDISSRHRVKTRSFRANSRGGIKKRRGSRLIGLSASMGAGVTRRSKRIIRAPRRPYDDFERTYDPDLVDQEEYIDSQVVRENGVFDPFRVNRRRRSHGSLDSKCSLHSDSSFGSNDDYDGVGESDSSLIPPHEVIKMRSKFRKHGRKVRVNNISPNESDISEESSDDEEVRYLQRASQLQLLNPARETFDSSHSLRKISDELSSNNRLPVRLGSVWNTFNWSMEQKRLNKNRVNEMPVSDDTFEDDEIYDEEVAVNKELQDRIVEDYEEVVEETEVKHGSERTTVEAAHLLLGISQMQSFRRQSGYLSLDSSGTSSTLENTVESQEKNCFDLQSTSTNASPLRVK